MPGSIHGRVNQSGCGHGNHRHASGNGLVCMYYQSFYANAYKSVKPKRIKPKIKRRARILKNVQNRRRT